MRQMIWLLLICCLTGSDVHGKTFRVPSQYSRIQDAINATGIGDTVLIASGRYCEVLHIDLKSIDIIGAGRDHTVIYKRAADTAHVYISNSSIRMRSLELNGGEYDAGTDWYVDATRRGIVCQNANLWLHRAFLNQYVNYMITMHGGTLGIDDVYLYSRPYGMQCDIGIQLRGAVADIVRLHQHEGMVDHTVDIYGGVEGYGRSEVWVRDSKIAASKLDWGDCIRAYAMTYLEVHNCEFYRPAGGAFPKDSHAGVSIMGYDITAYIRRNTFTGLPWGMRVLATSPTLGKSYVIFENNTIEQSILGGIHIMHASYEVADLGGGDLGSRGYNRFSNPGVCDVKLENTPNDIFAHYNWWSNQDPDVVIWDKLDDPALGKVQMAMKPYSPLLLYPQHQYMKQSPSTNLIWRRSGGALIYDVQLSDTRYFRTRLFEQYGIPDTSADAGTLSENQDYFWRVRGQNRWGVGDWSETFTFHVIKDGTLVDSRSIAGWKTDIDPVFPNPANAGATIRYSLAKVTMLQITVHDLLGRCVQTLKKGVEEAGHHELVWQAESLASGTYFITLNCPDFCKSVKVMVVK